VTPATSRLRSAFSAVPGGYRPLVRLIELLLLVKAPRPKTSSYSRYLPRLRPHPATSNSGRRSLQFQEAIGLADLAPELPSPLCTSAESSSPRGTTGSTAGVHICAVTSLPVTETLATTVRFPLSLVRPIWIRRIRTVHLTKGYRLIRGVHIPLDLMAHNQDPIEPVPTNQNQPRVGLRIKQKSK
jgi:hypothetical protein